MSTHTVLVAFEVTAESHGAAQQFLLDYYLPRSPSRGRLNWWIAEDGRIDSSDLRSDRDRPSAVLIPECSGLTQEYARRILELQAVINKNPAPSEATEGKQ